MAHEERLLTLFADVHYYFGEPVTRPLHHRFDKASYVYLYRDSTQKRGRLEIANHAGTPEQDAFTGFLDSSTISQSQSHPTLCTVVVDGAKPPQPSPTSSSDAHQWRLPSTDPRDEGNFLFRIHTVDLYFWTHEDAQLFVQSAQSTLQPSQLNIEQVPVHEHDDGSMSPVVQQLENIAIKDPAYQNGQTPNSRSKSDPSQPQAMQQEEKHPDPAAFVPLAYNPAAPPAPEVIKHREKTPPPPEAAAGTGLNAAAYHDTIPEQLHQTHSYAPSPSTGYFGSSPTYGQGHPVSSSSPYSPLSQASTAHAPHRTSVSSPQASVASPLSSPSFAPPPQDPNAHLYGHSATPMESPATQILGGSYVGGPQQPLKHLQPQYPDYLGSHPPQPIGGYSDYKYDQQQGQPHHHHHNHQSQPQANEYDIHSQVYRPTEEEFTSHGGKHKVSMPGQQAGKLEAKAEKVEKGLNRFLKKLENKIG